MAKLVIVLLELLCVIRAPQEARPLALLRLLPDVAMDLAHSLRELCDIVLELGRGEIVTPVPIGLDHIASDLTSAKEVVIGLYLIEYEAVGLWVYKGFHKLT